MSLTVTIVIPVYNGAATIAQAIRAALSQDCENLLEVIVVDDGSTDQTAAIVQSFPAQVKYLYQKNAGPASARNLGSRASKSDIVCFTDADCVAHPDWVSRMIPDFSDQTVAAVAGSYGIANPAKALAVCVYREIRYRHLRRLPRYPKVFGSYNVAIRRKILDEVKGFSTNYRYASGEDNDLSYNILRSGYKIYFEPSACVDHYHPVQVGKYLREQFRHGFWRVQMYLDHPAMMAGDDYTFWKDSLEVLLAFLCSAVLLFFCLVPCAWFFWAPLIALLLLETVFSFLILGPSPLTLFFSAVMFLRAFARTLGFVWGILNNFPRYLIKKIRANQS